MISFLSNSTAQIYETKTTKHSSHCTNKCNNKMQQKNLSNANSFKNNNEKFELEHMSQSETFYKQKYCSNEKNYYE